MSSEIALFSRVSFYGTNFDIYHIEGLGYCWEQMEYRLGKYREYCVKTGEFFDSPALCEADARKRGETLDGLHEAVVSLQGKNRHSIAVIEQMEEYGDIYGDEFWEAM